jgi:flagellar basal-body rod protein FlgF
MIKGIYAAASGMVSGLHRQAILTHNISNMNTSGYKQILTSMDDWEKTQVRPLIKSQVDVPFAPPMFNNLAIQQTTLLGDLGLGVENIPDTTDFNQGDLQQTDMTYDLAIQGDGFFQVQTPNGVRYTRDGRFNRDSAGNLVNVDGYMVLDSNGQSITLGDGSVAVDSSGAVMVDDVQVATLGIASFTSPTTELVRDGDNTYAATNPPSGTSVSRVEQGYLETSNVNIADAMTQMVSIGRSYQASQQLVNVQDTLLGKAIQSLG